MQCNSNVFSTTAPPQKTAKYCIDISKFYDMIIHVIEKAKAKDKLMTYNELQEKFDLLEAKYYAALGVIDSLADLFESRAKIELQSLLSQ